MTVTARASWSDVLAEGRAPLFALICLGVWVVAADSLVMATIMPSVGRALGSFAFLGWATAGFLLGSVLAGATSALLTQRFGLRRATAGAALICAIGCALSAAAPDIATFLVGRLLQGIGGGWVAGLCSVAIGLLFPNRLLPRVYAAITSIWGIATLIGPMIGGVFANWGDWRYVFWFFAVQALIVGAASLRMLPPGENGSDDVKVAWPQLLLVTLGVGAIGVADVAGRFTPSAALTVAGATLLVAMVWLDDRLAVRLLPRGARDLKSVLGAGYAALSLLTAASMGYSVYGPAVLQQLAGLSPLAAGYTVAVEAAAWTFSALLVAHLTGAWPGRLIRAGALCVALGVGASSVAFPFASIVGVIVAGAILGSGFGLSYSFMSQRVLAVLDGERGMGAAGLATVRLIGSAAGAAMAAAIANLVGFSHGLSTLSARSAGVWVFVAALPIAGLGVLFAWRLGAAHLSTQGERSPPLEQPVL